MPEFIHCHECDRGGLGNAEHKCSCGWRVIEPSDYGCYLGTPIVGDPRRVTLTAAQKRYRRWVDSDCGLTFIEFLKRLQWEKRNA